MNITPQLRFPEDERTLWFDQRASYACDHTGRTGPVPPGERRQKANLTDVLNAAHRGSYTRVIYVGPTPEVRAGVRHWLYVNTPGWESRSVWRNPDVGKFEKVTAATDDETADPERSARGFTVEVRTAAEWFGGLELNVREAREAWEVLRATVSSLSPGSRQLGLMRSPAATGANFWAASLPRDKSGKIKPLPAATDEIRAELHATDGQHRRELYVPGAECTCGSCRALVSLDADGKLPSLYYVDGRFMYSALCREIGVGGRRITAPEANDLLYHSDAGRYERARYSVTATVPDDWEHVGLLRAKLEEAGGWHSPNVPGATFTTWSDASEIDVALSAGWNLTVHEGILFTKARVMDVFAERIKRGRAAIEENGDLSPTVRKAVTVALRQMLVSGIGNLASRSRPVERTAATLREVPEDYRHEAVQHGNVFVWREPAAVNTVARNNWYWPEFAMQVWGRGRARTLSAPLAQAGGRGGALAVPAQNLIALDGDAIYTTELPTWALPTDHGGGDDGKPGRLRLEGGLPRPQTAPQAWPELYGLARRAEREGTERFMRGTR